MAFKYSDSELAARVRAANRRRSTSRRNKLVGIGKAALTVWVPIPLRQRFIDTATANNQTISELATVLLEAGLSVDSRVDPPSTIIPSEPDTLPLFNSEPTDTERKPIDSLFVSVGNESDKAARYHEVGTLLAEGLKGAEIARRFNERGWRTGNGAEFTGANLLRDYRRWCNKN